MFFLQPFLEVKRTSHFSHLNRFQKEDTFIQRSKSRKIEGPKAREIVFIFDRLDWGFQNTIQGISW